MQTGLDPVPQSSLGGAYGAKQPLQVRIPVEIKRRFKAKAAMLGIEPNELFVLVWAHYENTHLQATDSEIS